MNRFKEKHYALKLAKGATYYMVGDEGCPFSPKACHIVNSDYTIKDYNHFLIFEVETESPLTLLFDSKKYFDGKTFSRIILIKDAGAMIYPSSLWPVYLHLCLPAPTFDFSAKIIRPDTLIWKGKCLLCRSTASAMKSWRIILDSREMSARNLGIMLKDEDPQIRLNAASGLAFSGDEKSLVELHDRYAHENNTAVKKAMRLNVEKLKRRLILERRLYGSTY